MSRRIATCGVALSVIAVVIACVAAAPASATRLCKTASASCSEAETYPAKTVLKATQTEGVKVAFLAPAPYGNTECSPGSLQGETSAASGEPLPIKVSTWIFGFCSRQGNSCAITINPPASASIEATTGGNGTLVPVGAEVTFACGMITCSLAIPSLEFQGGSPAKLVANNVPTTVKGGLFCPKEATFDASYTVTAPNPVYVAK